MWTASLVIGFVICNILQLIPVSYGILDNIGITFVSVISGYICARIQNSFWIDKLVEFLKIRRTTNQYLWNDLMDKEDPMRCEIEIDGVIYCGDIHLIEEAVSKPQIVLSNFYINGENDKVQTNRVILLDTDKASKIIIIYSENSSMLKEISVSHDNKRPLILKRKKRNDFRQICTNIEKKYRKNLSETDYVSLAKRQILEYYNGYNATKILNLKLQAKSVDYYGYVAKELTAFSIVATLLPFIFSLLADYWNGNLRNVFKIVEYIYILFLLICILLVFRHNLWLKWKWHVLEAINELEKLYNSTSP